MGCCRVGLMSTESSVRDAAEAYLAGAVPLPTVAFGIGAFGDDELNPWIPGGGGRILSVLVLHAGTTAVVHVKWDTYAGWLTLLMDKGAWIVISAVTSTTAGSSTPADMAAVVKACWEEYCGANRTCDGERMAEVFHRRCRLTYTGPDGALVIKPHDAFVQMVSERYTTPMHAPYAHLRDGPASRRRGQLAVGVVRRARSLHGHAQGRPSADALDRRADVRAPRRALVDRRQVELQRTAPR